MAMKQELNTINSNTLSADELSTIINSGNLNAISPISWGVGIPSQWDSTITSTAPLPYDLEIIQGKLLQCNYEMSSYDMHTGGSYQLEPDYIKKKLTEMVVDKLLKDDLIYFTKINSAVSDSVRFIARLGVLEKDKTEFVAKKIRKA
jgi:hypothetical protein